MIFFLSQNDPRWPFWMTKNHFSPFQINTQLTYSHFLNFVYKIDQYATFFNFFLVKIVAGIHFFWMIENHFRSHFSPFQINTQLVFLYLFFTMAGADHFGSRICAKNNRVIPLCVINTVQITFIFIDFRVCYFAFAFKTQNAPCVSRFKRVLFSERFQFAF